METFHEDVRSGQKGLVKKIMLLSLVFILATIGGMWIQKLAIDNIYNKGFSGFQLSAKLSSDLSRVHANLYRLQSMTAMGQDKQEISNLANQQLETMNTDIALVKKTLNSSITAEEKKYYQGAMDVLTEYEKMASKIVKLASVGTASVYLIAADEKFQKLNQILSELTKYEGSVAENEYNSFARNYYIVVVLLLILFGGALFMISSLIKKLIGNILIPVTETAGLLREMAEGKHPKNFEWEEDDEIGELVQAVNAVRVKIGAGASTVAAPSSQPYTPPVREERRKAPPAPVADTSPKSSLSGMVRKTSEHTKEAEQLVTSSKQAIDKLRDIS